MIRMIGVRRLQSSTDNLSHNPHTSPFALYNFTTSHYSALVHPGASLHAGPFGTR